MSGWIGGSSPGSLSVSERINAPVAGKQATRQEEHLYPQWQGLHLLWMVRLVPGKTPLAEVSNTVRLAYVSVSLYWSHFESSIYKTTYF